MCIRDSDDGESLDGETVGIVVRTGRVQEAARRHEAALGDVALSDDLLRGVGHGTVGIAVEIAYHAVHLRCV